MSACGRHPCPSGGPGRVRPARTGAGAGFSLPEVIVALTILAVLLAAVGVATHAVMAAYAENAKIAEVTQAARVVLHRVIAEVRTADAVDSALHRISIIPPANPDGLTEIRYELDSGTLYCARTAGGSTTTHPLISSGGSVEVQSFSISRQTDLDGEGVTYTKSLTAKLGLKVGENRFDVTASACPRRNLTF